MGNLPKYEAWNQRDPDRPGLLPEPRYSRKDSLSEFVGFWQSFCTLANYSRETLSDPEGFW
jgi:hypothetical protein